jgi:uncharacterized delta-60 repeat protein
MRALFTLVQQAVWAAAFGFALFQSTPSLAVPGQLDTAYSQDPLPYGGGVIGIATQPDGKTIFTGGWGGIPSNSGAHKRIARLGAATGAQDLSYTPSFTSDGQAEAIQFLPDGKLLVAGSMTSLNGAPCGLVVRLNSDGTRDTSFSDPLVTGLPNQTAVYTMAVQADGKIIIGGGFTAVGGVARLNMARLNADGTLDASLNPGPDYPVQCLALLADQRIVVGGSFSTIAGSTGYDRDGFAVLHPNGTLASTTTPGIGNPQCLLVQPDGKIIVGGQSYTAGFSGNGIARLNADLTLDTSFNPDLGVLPNTAPGRALSMALQADGKIIIGGDFRSVGGVERNRGARLNANGTLDTSFDPNFDGDVYSVGMQQDGKIFFGGFFQTAGTTASPTIARFENSLPTDQLRRTSSARIEWLRGGSAPEASSVTFEQSTDSGATWTTLGSGTRIPGGWELTGLSMPTNVRLRGSALIPGGRSCNSRGLVQTVEDFPLVPPALAVEQPASTPLTSNSSSVDFGSVVTGLSSASVTFTLRNTGSGVLKRMQFSIDDAQATEFAITPPSVTELASGADTSLSIVFTPGAKLPRNATLRISSNDPTHPIFSVPLTGTGVASPNADLTSIGLPPQMVLSPAFSTNTLSYNVNAIFNRKSITIIPTAVNAISAITVNGNAVVSGANSASINLATGANVITIIVTAENGINTKTYTLTVNRATSPLPGELDLAFNPYVDHWVSALAQQPDGKLLVGGFFTNFGGPFNSVGSALRYYFGRVNADGSLDSFNSTVNLATAGVPISMKLLRSGQILAAGAFPSATPNTLKPTVALINADASSVANFDPVANDDILQVALVPSGDVLIAGEFTTVQAFGAASPTTRNYIARLNASGTLDTAFNANPNGLIRSLCLQDDGKIIIAGDFTMVGAAARSKVARLTATGAVDTTFTAPAIPDGDVKCVLVQPNGQILIGGSFPEGDGLLRLNTNGSLDAAFNTATPIGNRQVNTLALQDDGKILMGGYGYNGHSSLERINADGSVDTSFSVSVQNTNSPGSVDTLVIQETGQIVIGGSFRTVNGEPRNNLARVEGATSQSLEQITGSTVEWYAPGMPPANSTVFEYSEDDGSTWTVIDATGARVGDRWQGTVATALPTSGGLLRVRAAIDNGQYTELVFAAPFAPPASKIVVEQPVDTDLEDEDVVNLGTLGINVLVPTVFTIRNAGGQNLTLSNVTITGTNAGQFSIIDQPTLTVAPLESTTFTVQAKITTAGAKTAMLNITSNDSTATPFNITLNVSGTAAVAAAATTLAATGLDQDGVGIDAMRATLNGTVDANGQPREVSFEYGPTTSYGTTITLPGTFDSANPVNVSTQITGLPPHTTFNYRVRIDGDLGNALGVNKTFTTANRAPVAGDDSAQALPSVATTIDVLDDDMDADGDSLLIASKTAVTPSTAGSVAIVANQLVFTASAAFGTGVNATATFGYKVSDGEGGTDDGIVTMSLGSATLDLTTKSITAEGTTFETPSSYPVAITTTGSWAVTEALTWATVSPISGRGNGIANIAVQPNTSTATRTGVIKLGGVAHTITQAGVLKPTLGPMSATTYNAVVGGAFELAIPTVNAPVTYTVTGMPPGLSISNFTGIISGRPTMAGTTATNYSVTVKASNAAGPTSTDTAGKAAATVSFTINVIPLPAGAVGTFQGLIERSNTVNVGTTPNLGARWNMTVTPLGMVTGKIIEGVTSRSFTGQLEVTPATANAPTLTAAVTGTALTLDLKMDALTDSLTSGAGENVLRNAINTQSSIVTGWGNAWSTTAPVKKASDYKGPYSFVISNPATTAVTNLAAPDGYGFGRFTITENTGALSFTGELPDGSDIVCATFVGQHGQVLLYAPLHGNKGSIHGQLTITTFNAPTDNSVDGTLTWLKPTLLSTAKDKAYQSGFGPLTLDVIGSTYLPPAKGLRVLGLPAPPAIPTTATNAKLAFTLGGLDTASLTFDQLIRISNPSVTGLTNTATVAAYNLATSTNLNKVAIASFSAPTGLFAGSFTLPGTTTRLGPFYGQIVRIIGTTTTTQGYGYFLLPTGVPNETASPKYSGRVELTAP